MEYINKNCKNLEDFIINDQINHLDLKKLADLNNIYLDIPEVWFPLAIELVKELYDNGWNKKVSCIKEKFGRLKFYITYNEKLFNIIEKYGDTSESF